MSAKKIRYDFPGVEQTSVILRLAAETMDSEIPPGLGIYNLRVGIDFPPGTGQIVENHQGGSGYVSFLLMPLAGGLAKERVRYNERNLDSRCTTTQPTTKGEV